MSKEIQLSDSSFLALCFEGNLDAIEVSDSSKVNYNCSIKYATPLTNALLAYEEAVERKDSTAQTACEKLVLFLINQKANLHNPNTSNAGRNITPFHTICMKGFMSILEAIIKDNPQNLSYTSDHVGTNDFFETRDFRGMNVLMLAIEKKQFETVKLLLFAIPRAQLQKILELHDSSGYTLLSWLYFLLPNKPMQIDANSRIEETYSKMCILSYALASMGANLWSLNPVQKPSRNMSLENALKGIQLLFNAVKENNEEVVRQNQSIIQFCDSYNLYNEEGNPILYSALKLGKYTLVELLLHICPELITQKNRLDQNLCEFCIINSSAGIEMFKFLVALAFKKQAESSTQSSTGAILSIVNAPVAQ